MASIAGCGLQQDALFHIERNVSKSVPLDGNAMSSLHLKTGRFKHETDGEGSAPSCLKQDLVFLLAAPANISS